MRFSRRNVLAALPAICAAAVLPSTSDPPSSHIDIEHNASERPTFVFLDPALDQPNAVFSVPCAGCEDDDALLFNFQAFPSLEPCGVSNVTVNGRSLSQIWNGTHALGEGSVLSLPYSSLLPQHDLGLSWESSCLLNDASESTSDTSQSSSQGLSTQVITVTLQTIDGKPVEQLSGFTISFRPQIPLELLRLSAVPILSATEQPITPLWHSPPPNLRLNRSLESPSEHETTDDLSLEDHVRELTRLEAEVTRIKELIQHQRSLIGEHIEEDTSDLPEDTIHQCRSVKCLVDDLLQDARAAIEDLYMKIKPAFTSFSGSRTQQISIDPGRENRIDPALIPTPLTHGFSASSIQATATATPTSSTHHHYTTLPDSPSTPNNEPIDPFRLTLKIVGLVTGLTCIFILFRRSTCTSPRARAERLATQEARRTEREYRRAARSYRVRKWWSAWTGRRRDAQRITDYEEKRSLIRQQEGVLEGAMQDEIRMLRAAHEAVHSIISGGSSTVYAPTITNSSAPIPIVPRVPRRQQHMQQQREFEDFEPDLEAWHTIPLSRTSSLPDYRSDAGSSHFSSEPPAYSDDEGDVVTDGFRGYRSGGGRGEEESEPSSPVLRETTRWSESSSVISTSPRPSQETMRMLRD